MKTTFYLLTSNIKIIYKINTKITTNDQTSSHNV